MEHVLFANHSLIFIPWFTVGLMVLMAINHRLLYLTICEADRYEVKFEGGRYDTVACALIPMGFHGFSWCISPCKSRASVPEWLLESQ